MQESTSGPRTLCKIITKVKFRSQTHTFPIQPVIIHTGLANMASKVTCSFAHT